MIPLIPTEQIEDAIWQELERAPLEKQHPWRTPVLATTATSGAKPQARVVVLRKAKRNEKLLRCFTHKHSAKVTQLQGNAHAEWVFWHPGLQWQLRVATNIQILTQASVLQPYWNRLRLGPTAGDYLAAGAAVPEQVEASGFCLLEAQVLSLDWLELGDLAQRRYTKDYSSGLT